MQSTFEAALCQTTGQQDLPARQQGGAMAHTLARHASSASEAASLGIVDFHGLEEDPVLDHAACDQYLAIRQQCRGMVRPGLTQSTCGQQAPGWTFLKHRGYSV